MRRLFVLVCALLIFCALPAGATPGGTDGNGGHIDKVTGEYHFHHGYPAHQHINGVCPYDPNFTSNVVTGPAESISTDSEDKDDTFVPNFTKVQDATLNGARQRGQAGLIATGILMALVIVGGFLSTVKWRKKS